MATDTFLNTGATRLRACWLTGNAIRITHFPLQAEGVPPDQQDAPGDRRGVPVDRRDAPADRPWLRDVFIPVHPPAEEEIEIWPQVVDGCLQLLNPHFQPMLVEKAPPRLGVNRLDPYLNLDIPKIELRSGVRQVQGGVQLSLSIREDEIFYGWGEQFTAFGRRAGKLKLHTRDALAPLQQRGETYSAIPFFFSSRGYAFLLLNSYPSRWQIDPDQQHMLIDADGPGADYLFIYGPSFKRILQTYTTLTGRPPLLPRWAFGLWATSYPQGPQEGVVRHIEEHRQRDLPLDAVILDYHWEEAFHNFHWRRSLIPDPDRLIQQMQALGVRLGLILTPFVNQRTRPLQKLLLSRLAGNIPPGLEKADERALPEYEHGLSRGYFAHPHARWWFGEGGMIDFTNPSAVAWWTGMLHPLYQQGVSFFKNDDGEYLPHDAHSANGMSGAEYHNLYGFYYGRAHYQDMQSLARRGLIYARSVWAGSQRYPALFLGDQKPTFAHIRSTLRAGLNLGLQGFAYWTADVFGLDGKTTPETHMRYAQWALLNPIARYFWRPPHIDDTRFPWSHNQQVEDNFRKYAGLRYRLLPYFNTLAWQAYQEGLPLLRPLVLEFPDDEQAALVDDQAMLGEQLMICPVVEPGASFRQIYLPAGVWHDFWSAATWEGPTTIAYPTPLDCLPILVRGGTILPLGPALQHIPDEHAFTDLQVHVWPPYPASGLLYDDDGYSLAYQEGQFARTLLHAEANERHLRVHIGAAQGNFPGLPLERQLELIIHHSQLTRLVQVHRQALQDWRLDAQRSETIIHLALKTGQETTIILE